MKLKHILLATTLSAFAFSCSDSFLTDTPRSEIVIGEFGAIKTRADLEIAVNGLYGRMNSASAFGANHFTYQELTGDLGFVSKVNSGRFYTTNEWGHLSSDDGASAGIWNNLYNIIANANLILEYEGKITDDEMGPQPVKQLFAHAKAVRAYCYTTLLTYFSPNYGEGDQSLGVPYPVKYDIEAKLPRVTVGQAYTNVINDLTSALTGFTGSAPGNKTFNPVAVKLLLARVYLYQKNYPLAILTAQEVLDDPSSQLLPRDKAGSYYLPSSEDSYSETLFQLQETNAVNLGSNDAISATWSSSGTYKQNFMVRSFWDTFPSTDIRKSTWYLSNTFVNNLTQDTPRPIDVRKYTSTGRDVIQFRKTEAIFIKAEAQYHTAPATAAVTLQSWVKTYRDTGYTVPAASGQALLDEILRQKGFEFFLEGHRLTDLKRNHKPIIKPQTNFNVPADNYRFIWPIPQTEIQTNPNVKQATGY